MERNGVKLFNFFRSPCLLLQAGVIKEKAEEDLPLGNVVSGATQVI
jgi:hypothetical protein